MAKKIQCPTCKKWISVEAETCPKCGQVIDDKIREQGLKALKTGKIGCLVIIVVLVVVVFVYLLPDKKQEQQGEAGSSKVQESQTTESKMTSLIKDLDQRIKQVDYTTLQSGGLLALIFFTGESAWNESSFFFSSAESFKNISKDMAQDKEFKEISSILFFLKAPTVDKYGKSSQDMVMKLSFSMSELRKVNWNNFTNWSFLNLADQIELRPLGRKIVQAFCAEEDNGKYARPFCMKALMRQRP